MSTWGLNPNASGILTKVHSAWTNELIQRLETREQKQGFLHNTEIIIEKHVNSGEKPGTGL